MIVSPRYVMATTVYVLGGWLGDGEAVIDWLGCIRASLPCLTASISRTKNLPCLLVNCRCVTSWPSLSRSVGRYQLLPAQYAIGPLFFLFLLSFPLSFLDDRPKLAGSLLSIQTTLPSLPYICVPACDIWTKGRAIVDQKDRSGRRRFRPRSFFCNTTH